MNLAFNAHNDTQTASMTQILIEKKSIMLIQTMFVVSVENLKGYSLEQKIL